MINLDVNRNSLVSSCSSLDFPTDPQIWFLILSDKLVTLKMQERGFLDSCTQSCILYYLQKENLSATVTKFAIFYSFCSYCYVVLFFLIIRNSLLFTYIFTYLQMNVREPCYTLISNFLLRKLLYLIREIMRL